MPPLTYQQVRSNDIDVDAQRSLMRMSNRPETMADANCIAAAVQSGELQGIYAENQKKPALRARDKLGRGWWQLIPKGEDAVVVLDPAAAPLIAFREKIRGDQAALDQAILKAWRSARRLLSGKITTRCGPGTTPVRNIVPEGHCDSGAAGDGPDCCCVRIETISIWVNTFVEARPATGAVLLGRGEFEFSPRTAVPSHGVRCYVTDQRGWSDGARAASRTRSSMILDVNTGAVVQVPTIVGLSVEADCAGDNEVRCRQTAPTPANAFGLAHRPSIDPLTYRIPFVITLTDPCAPHFVTSVRAEFTIVLGPSLRSATITFSGGARLFNMEAYAVVNDCRVPVTIIRAFGSQASLRAERMRAIPLEPFSRTATLTCGACICAADQRLLPRPPGRILTA